MERVKWRTYSRHTESDGRFVIVNGKKVSKPALLCEVNEAAGQENVRHLWTQKLQ
jgi:hypothetical protein